MFRAHLYFYSIQTVPFPEFDIVDMVFSVLSHLVHILPWKSLASCNSSNNFSISIESENVLSWKGPTKMIEANSCLWTGPPKNLKAMSKCFLNYGRLGAVTASLWSLFQCPVTLLVKNFFLNSSWKLTSSCSICDSFINIH